MRFSWHWGDLELRSCNASLLSDGEHTTAEIIKWLASGHCIAVAYWIATSEGFDLKFVGDRPFDVDPHRFMQLAQHGQNMLRSSPEYRS